MTLRLRSHAKINWHLEVLGRRQDGFHELLTLFQTVALHDDIEIEIREAGIDLEIEPLTADGESTPAGESNLAWRAARLFLDRFSQAAGGVALRLRKRIPVGGGLGGGSSNAATVLTGLAALSRPRPALAELEGIAAELGADVPYFLHGGVAIGYGRGDRIRPLPDDGIEEQKIWLAVPPIAVSTKEVFGSHRLTPGPPSSLEPWIARGLPRRLSELGGRNDLEATCFALHPEVGRVYDLLIASGASWVRLSGSGATLVATFESAAAADGAGRTLPEGVRWLPSRTLRRATWRDSAGF